MLAIARIMDPAPDETHEPPLALVPIPRVSGHPVLGHLRAFREDRAAVQLRVAREQPEIARLRIGLVPAVMIGVARARARGARRSSTTRS